MAFSCSIQVLAMWRAKEHVNAVGVITAVVVCALRTLTQALPGLGKSVRFVKVWMLGVFLVIYVPALVKKVPVDIRARWYSGLPTSVNFGIVRYFI